MATSMPKGETLRLVILGKTGVGKSAIGNTIVRRTDAFVSKPSASSVTQICSMQQANEGRLIQVIDTPGVLDTERPAKDITKEILRCIHISSPGPHAFLLVIQVGRFTQEEQNAVKALQELFGKKAADYMIVVFSRADELGDKSIQDYVQEGSPKLREVIRSCGDRYLAFDNKDIQNRYQVVELVKKVDEVLKVEKSHFTNEMYEQSKTDFGTFVKKFLDYMSEKVRHMQDILHRYF